MKDRTSLSLRGVPLGRDDEAIYLFTKKAERYKGWDCFVASLLAMTINCSYGYRKLCYATLVMGRSEDERYKGDFQH